MYSSVEFRQLRELINEEILRRGSYKWWDPLTVPAVGEDRRAPLTIPVPDKKGTQMQINEKTYTINNPSEGSIESTRNINYPAHDENPGGKPPAHRTTHDTSALKFDAKELRNYIVGLAKIKDINLYYGRDEVPWTSFRDPQCIEDVLIDAQKSERNRPLASSDISPSKNDPNKNTKTHKNPNYPASHLVTYPKSGGEYVMPSGESDGEEVKKYEGLGPRNFYDDYGASPGDINYHPLNPFVSEYVDRSGRDEGEYRDKFVLHKEGGIPSSTFGTNPRNPNPGSSYKARAVTGGVIGACNVACTGLCYQTCDSECSESCATTCWNRCGESCTSTCGNICTGCNTMCYTSCRTKCQSVTGYSCIKAGAKTVKIYTTGGQEGVYAKNNIETTTYSCNGCAYSCQFYPNKKTECWDSGCMGKCFTSCTTYCSATCFGGCIDNANENTGAYKTGIGRGCSSNCTVNCIGLCQGVCEGYCIQTCWHACKATCSDNCSWKCFTNCGSNCANKCKNGCGGCSSCEGSCEGHNSKSGGCVGCGTEAGCTATCQHDCNTNCIGWGCRSVCGTGDAGACEANCRINCMTTSCTAQCSEACSSWCTQCVNTCGIQCGACTSQCSTGCTANCNITCSEKCAHNCTLNCVMTCSEACGGCSNLCYSCVGLCIGVCSVKCEQSCSSCTNQCGWWCDSTCNRYCFNDCDNRCINTCSGSCATYLESNTTSSLAGPERDPTAEGYIYPHPENRFEEQDSFRFYTKQVKPPKPVVEPTLIEVGIDDDNNFYVTGLGEFGYVTHQTTLHGGVYNLDESTGKITINAAMIPGVVHTMLPNPDEGGSIFIAVLYKDPSFHFDDEDITVKIPFGFSTIPPIHDKDGNIIVIIERDKFLLPGEEE
jgi:hypothetical protein